MFCFFAHMCVIYPYAHIVEIQKCRFVRNELNQKFRERERERERERLLASLLKRNQNNNTVWDRDKKKIEEKKWLAMSQLIENEKKEEKKEGLREKCVICFVFLLM